jgi:signal peptidase II
LTEPATALHGGQIQALDELLSLLDERSARKAIALFGPSRSGKSALLATLAVGGSRALRTPQHHKVVCTVIDATQLPADVAPWQHLMMTTLDTLAIQPGPPSPAIRDLRAELSELIQHEANNDDSATLAAAAFAHHFRAAFPGVMHSAISLGNATLVIALDNLERAKPEDAAQLLEASKYFLNAQACAALICADEDALVATLSRTAIDADGGDILRKWMTARIDLHSAPLPVVTPIVTPVTTPVATPVVTDKPAPKAEKAETKPRSTATSHAANIPASCLQILNDALLPDTAAVEHAAEQWRAAMQGIARRNAEGYDTYISGALVAKLVAIKSLSPRLFDAARFDAPLLSTLERYARSGQLIQTSDIWANLVASDPRLTALFNSPPSFIGVELRDLATALRLIHAADETAHEPASITVGAPGTQSGQSAAPASGARAAVAREAAPAPAASAAPMTAPNPAESTSGSSIWMIISVAAMAFIADRLVKLALLSGFGPISDWLRLEIAPASSVFSTGAALGAELLGLALAILIVLFWGGSRGSRAYAIAFGLIIGGMASNLFDRVAYGAVMNYLHVANLPVFNLAHVALLLGAVLLAYSILSGRSGSAKSAVGQRAS